MKFLKQAFSANQIKALLKKDILIRLRQPWMTIIQVIWPCLLFLLLYIFRSRFEAYQVKDCQYQTRQLPTKDNIIPFFHSYICTIENKCQNVDPYEEYTTFENAPLKPILNIAQIFVSDNSIYDTIVGLPSKANFVSAATSLITNSNLGAIQKNIEKVIASVPQVEKMIGGHFDIKKLFSDRKTFVTGGKIICGHPFPSSDNIRVVDDILYSEDFSEINDDELDAMPTKYCKKLYLDVTSSNNGKMTWTHIKPIIHGKILYGPDNEDTSSIIKYSNTTFEELGRLKDLTYALDLTLTKLRTDKKFKEEYDKLLDLAKSPIIRTFVGSAVDQIEVVLKMIATDDNIADIVKTIKNILECFSVDRFTPINSEAELTNEAFKLNKKRLFYAGVYFDKTEDKNVVYKMRVDTDNTPVTIENRNRFFFPGPEDSMVDDMKYHRGFVQVKHSIDTGIIRFKKSQLNIDEDKPPKSDGFSLISSNSNANDDWDDDGDDAFFTDNDPDYSNNEENDTLSSTATPTTETNVPTSTSNSNSNNVLTDLLKGLFSGSSEPSGKTIKERFDDDDDWDDLGSNFKIDISTNEEDENSTQQSETEEKTRKRRSPQMGSLLNMFLGGLSSKKTEQFDVDKVRVYTKQFPYPAYKRDTFKRMIYLSQAVQMCVFIGLMAQIAACVRHRIWMKESRNTMLMRSMGLKASSEISTWIFCTFIELTLIFIACLAILYAGNILENTKIMFLLIYFTFFGFAVISFCYMCSTIFSSATIGSVSATIFFFLTFLPYIVIICLDAHLSGISMFVANLSFTTAFCYAWDVIMRVELQGDSMMFATAFNEGLDNAFTYAFCMIILDTILYAIIGYTIEKFYQDEFQFNEVPRIVMENNIGATIRNVSKVYNDIHIAVSNVSLDFTKDQVTCLLGRNGSGKSTILKMLTGQIQATNGSVALSKSLIVNSEIDKIGLCSQDNILIPHMTAKEHLNMYARIKLKSNYDEEVNKTLLSMKFGKYEDYEACKLSGGYQRRLCVAIAFIGSPNLVILDEPCNGVDTKARRFVWELVEGLRKGRTVVLATHYLDEAEYLSDSIVILSNGKTIAKHNPQTLKNIFLQHFEITIVTKDLETIEIIRRDVENYLGNFKILQSSDFNLKMAINYDQGINKCPEFIAYLETLEKQGRVEEIIIKSKSLEEIFSNLNKGMENLTNGDHKEMDLIDLKKQHALEMIRDAPLTRRQMIKQLIWKRLLHFSRNYRVLLSILVLPTLFEILSMTAMKFRPGGEFDTVLNLSRGLYPDSTQFLSSENLNAFPANVYSQLSSTCHSEDECVQFTNSSKAFSWILETTKEYQRKRYGGVTFNDSLINVWYNNKGYHSMMSWLNDLNSNMLKAEMNDSSYEITTFNAPLKLGDHEITTSSLLQQAADSGVSLILLLAFSLIVAGTSVFIVNERTTGEKLQQRLCGVDVLTYWGVAFIWDFMIFLIGLFVCIGVLKFFAIPVFVDKENLSAIFVLILLYGFACIPGIYVFEKLFNEASMANMMIFCFNSIVGIFTVAIIVIFDILGESDNSVEWRNFFNRAFLIFPQHALTDGLIAICKNYVVAEVFVRFDLDVYKNPLKSDLLAPNFASLISLGILFMIINYIIESGAYDRILKHLTSRNKPNNDLKIVSIQSTLQRNEKLDNYAVVVENLSMSYHGKNLTINDVSFQVKVGECFGLIGKNGAGKSTIFKILSGQLYPSSGSVDFFNKEISYCPQTNALDSLLTVQEIIKFYGHLRRIHDMGKLVDNTLHAFNLESYRKVLVKNLSGGNRRKLNVAVACIGRSEVILMDEPTSDMDPVTRTLVYKAIENLIAERRSVILTSHTISEIDDVCHRICVLKDGKVISNSSPGNMEKQFGGYYSITIFCDEGKSQELEKEICQSFPQCNEIQRHMHSLKFDIKIQELLPLELNGNSTINNNESMLKKSDSTSTNLVTLAELFQQMNNFAIEHSIQFTINRCRLDTVFEKILDSNETDGGYVHKSFVQTEKL